MNIIKKKFYSSKKKLIINKNQISRIPLKKISHKTSVKNKYIRKKIKTKKMSSKLKKTMNIIKNLISKADSIILGAGSGLSTAAGLEYSGKRWEKTFPEFIKKYKMTDMYTSSFYKFQNEEEKWGYWGRHLYVNNVGCEAFDLYKDLYNFIKDKDYFVITTNVDDQFYKSGFDENRIFRTQGSYKFLQCAKGCNNKTYESSDLIKKLNDNIDKDCKVPSNLVPYCEKCKGSMDPNIRMNDYFVEDNIFQKGRDNYINFLKKCHGKKVILIEMGIGMNTPGIIRFPFEKMTLENKDWYLIRLNRSVMDCMFDMGDKIFLIKGDIKTSLNEIIH